MSKVFIENQTFKTVDFTETKLKKGDYEVCVFEGCTFSNSDLSEINFTKCAFVNCDLSMVNLKNTAFREVRFRECKLLGLRFEVCNPFLFSANFDTCQLDFASFFQRSVPNTEFKECSLNETDFSETDLSDSVFQNCDLTDAVFDQTNLEKCDFRTARNYAFHPELNRIKGAKFSVPGVLRLLDKYGIEIEF